MRLRLLKLADLNRLMRVELQCIDWSERGVRVVRFSRADLAWMRTQLLWLPAC